MVLTNVLYVSYKDEYDVASKTILLSNATGFSECKRLVYHDPGLILG